MNRIRVQNFGPIRDSGWVDIKKVTVFLGNQGSGKSTLTKLIAIFLNWERATSLWQTPELLPDKRIAFFDDLLPYYRLTDYYRADSVISYVGEDRKITVSNRSVTEEKSKQKSNWSRLLYFPAERNLLSALMEDVTNIKLLQGVLLDLVRNYWVSMQNLQGEFSLPIGNTSIYCDKARNVIFLHDSLNTFQLKLSDAASGFHSLVPLLLIIQHFKNHPNSGTFTASQQQLGVPNDSGLINIIEEPEQNLYPSSQKHLLYSLLGFNNEHKKNQLIVTTHSPYLVNALTLAVQGAELKGKIGLDRKDMLDRLDAVVPVDAVTPASDVAVYQFDESKGTVTLLPMPHGIPSDANYLNESLGASNDAFGRLLDIEEELG